MAIGGDNVKIAGPYIPWNSPTSNPAPEENGSAFRIGDGYWITAGHIVYEFNQESSVGDRDIFGDSRIALDFYGYKQGYLNVALSLPTSLTYVDSNGNTQHAENENLEGLGGLDLSGKDAVVISGSGNVDETDAGLVSFLNPSDLTLAGILIGSDLNKYWNYTDASGVSQVGHEQTLITSLTGHGDGFNASVSAAQGQSGGGYILDYDGRHFLLGVQSAMYGGGGNALGVALSPAYVTQINTLLLGGHFGDVTHSEPANLVVGSDGADTDGYGSWRPDIVLGRGGDDWLDDGDTPTSTVWANDTLIGGAGNDTLVGGRGDDTFWGGDENDESTSASVHDLVDYSGGTKPITVTYDGSAATPTLTVADGTGGTDHLHGIEDIKATTGRDVFKIVGDIQGGTHLTWDANEGQGSNPTDTINTGQASASVHVNIQSDGTGSIASGSVGGGEIDLVGFHTGIVGSDFDDQITDLSSGTKRVSGGDGNDVVTVDNGAGILDGGYGDDTLNGGNGNDVLDGGDGFNQLFGGDGSDKLIGHGSDDDLDGGDGADYLQAFGGGALDGGAGDDVLDVTHAPGSTIYMGADGGNDLVLGTPTAIDLGSFSKSEISFVFSSSADSGEESPGIGSPLDMPGSAWVRGDLTIIAGGTSLTLHDVSGGGIYYDYHYSGDLSTLRDVRADLPLILTADGDIYGGNWDTNKISFGVTGSSALAEYNSAVASDGAEDGTSGNDDLSGGSGDDSLSGGAGDDSFYTSGGTDHFDGGDGNDEIVALGSSWQFSVSSEGHQVLLSNASGPDGQFALSSIESIYFQGDDQTAQIVTGSVQADSIQADNAAILFGDDGDDTIVGSAASDTIVGGTGSDLLSGGDGSDSYSWKVGDGNDTIIDSASDESYNFLTLSNVASSDVALAQDGDDLLLTIHSTGEVIRLAGQLAADGVSGLDEIDFANDAFWSRDNILNHLNPTHVDGTSDNDAISGSSGPDVINPGAGDDTIEASGDDDTILWNLGDGDDRLVDRAYMDGGSDTIEFGTGIASTDVSVFHDWHQTDQIILHVAQGGSLTLDGVTADAMRDLQIEFADGMHWSLADVLAKADAAPTPIDGTPSDDNISGTARADLIAGYGGDDTLDGGQGADIYLYASGDGNDVIFDTGNQYTVDELSLTDLNPDQVILERGGNVDTVDDLRVTDIVTGEQITVTEQFGSNVFRGIEQLHFADGSTLDRAGILSAASEAHVTDGDDVVGFAWSGFSVEPGKGDDTIAVDGSGGGTIIFGAGDGHDHLQSNLGYGYDRTDTLQLRDLNPDDVTLTRSPNGLSGDELVVTVNATGDTFTALFQFNGYDENAGLDRIVFQDGTTWSRSDLPNEVLEPAINGNETSESLLGSEGRDEIHGAAGNDTINGGDGADTLLGDGGADVLIGGNGDDHLISDGISNDTLTGGLCADTFSFESATSFGVITDFDTDADTLFLLNGLQIHGSIVSDYNHDGAEDLILTFGVWSGVALLGVNDLSAVHFDYATN